MKVIAKRKYYEKDLYRGPRPQILFSLDEIPNKKDAVLVHKKGDLADYDFKIKYCCNRGRRHIKVEGRWNVNGNEIVPGAFLFLNNNDECIDFCPFCGEEIEMYERD